MTRRTFFALMILALVGAACSQRSPGSAAPTPPSQAATPTLVEPTAIAPTATGSPAGCPVDRETCAAAEKFLAAWERHDVAAIMDMAHALPTVCHVPRPQGEGGPYPLCEDAAVNGEVREGFVWSSGSSGGLTSRAGLRAQLEKVGPLPLATIGCEFVQQRCADAFVLEFGPVLSYGPDLGVLGEAAFVVDASTGAAGFLGLPNVFVAGNCPSNPSGHGCERVIGGMSDAVGYRYWGDETQMPRPLPRWQFFRWKR